MIETLEKDIYQNIYKLKNNYNVESFWTNHWDITEEIQSTTWNCKQNV